MELLEGGQAVIGGEGDEKCFACNIMLQGVHGGRGEERRWKQCGQ